MMPFNCNQDKQVNLYSFISGIFPAIHYVYLKIVAKVKRTLKKSVFFFLNTYKLIQYKTTYINSIILICIV